MFRKDDIKAGYLVKLSNGKYCIVNVNERNQNGICVDLNMYCDIFNFDENLYCDWRNVYIDEIYGRVANGFLNDNSPQKRKLLWARDTYRVGDKFVISNISVQSNTGDYVKKTEYKSVKGTITETETVYGNAMYILSFDNHTIIVGKEYLDDCKKVN